MTLNKFFYSVASLLLLLAAFMFASTFFITPELIYPLRVDSAYVKYESDRLSRMAPDTPGGRLPLLFNPASLGMPYENFNVKTGDGLTLRGWYVSSHDEEANTLLIIHDLSQSKINYINLMKQMYDRGLNVCAVDLRAHGTSEGQEFSAGMVAVADIWNIVDSLLVKPETNHIVVFGAGIGAGIAIQAAGMDGRCDALIAQSPFNNFSDYVDRYARRKWGRMSFVLRVILERALEKRLQYELTDLELAQVARYVRTPTLFICGSNDTVVIPAETYAVYDSSDAVEKNMILVRNATHENIEQVGGEEYYNKIAEFILSTVPKKQKDTRYKKLALND